MFAKNPEYICVSLSDDVLRIVQLKGSGASLKVTHAVARDVKGVVGADLVKAIQSSLGGFNTKSANVYSLIPSSLTTTKNIEIPSVSPEEIKSIVSLQAGRHTPFSREEIQTGYINIGVYKSNYTKVLLVIANKAQLKEQLGIFEKAGLRVKRVLFGAEGIAGFYTRHLNNSGENPIGIIDIGKQSTDFIIALGGKPITTRTIGIGKSQLISEGAAASERFIEELRRTIESYQSEDIEKLPTDFIFTSDDESIKSLQPLLQQKLNWVVNIVPYVDGIKLGEDILKRFATDLSEYSLLDLIASSSTLETSQINLIPEEVQLQKAIELQGREAFTAAIYALIILVLVAVNFGLEIYFKNTFLNKLRDGYRDNRDSVVSLENRSSKVQMIQSFLASRMMSLDVLNEVYKNIPTEVYLTGISMDELGSISVQGISDVGSLVYSLNTTLKEGKLFKSADVKEKTAKKDRGKDVHAFEIALKLQSAPDEVAAEDPKSSKTAGTVNKGDKSKTTP